MTKQEFEKRKNELKERLQNAKDEELEEIRSAIEELEKAEIVDEPEDNQEEKQEEQEKEEKVDERSLLKGAVENLEKRNLLTAKVIEKPGKNKEERKMEEDNKVIESAAKELRAGNVVKFSMKNKEERSVTVSGGTLLVPGRTKTQIAESFDRPSAMADKLNIVPLNGGESYSVAFEKDGGEGGYTVEGGNYQDIDPEFDHVSTGRAKVTAYAEITEEVEKLPDADYVSRVGKAVEKAIKKKIGAQAVAGPGTDNTIRGIYNADVKVLDGNGDIEIASIDQDTLNTIVFGFGGEEAVEDEQTLILNKKDLEAFSKVKNNHGDFVYKITKGKGEGRISYSNGGADVPYIINSACTALSATSTEAGAKTMIYGSLTDYEFPVFSDIETKMSEDYKFKQGMKAFKASCIVGGTVSKFNGFSRIKKAATV
ncbi:MAG: phage major capsid protein [Clostridia bacterium]|nr:phage major capsid protein [Clostridia bacterium]